MLCERSVFSVGWARWSTSLPFYASLRRSWEARASLLPGRSCRGVPSYWGATRPARLRHRQSVRPREPRRRISLLLRRLLGRVCLRVGLGLPPCRPRRPRPRSLCLLIRLLWRLLRLLRWWCRVLRRLLRSAGRSGLLILVSPCCRLCAPSGRLSSLVWLLRRFHLRLPAPLPRLLLVPCLLGCVVLRVCVSFSLFRSVVFDRGGGLSASVLERVFSFPVPLCRCLVVF